MGQTCNGMSQGFAPWERCAAPLCLQQSYPLLSPAALCKGTLPAPQTCSLAHILHFSQPTQSMMRVMLWKVA